MLRDRRKKSSPENSKIDCSRLTDRSVHWIGSGGADFSGGGYNQFEEFINFSNTVCAVEFPILEEF